jgi:hypothetical protein
MVKISYSRHDTYSKSPRAYYLQYIAGLMPDKYKGSFILGDCFDQAVGQLSLDRDVEGAIKMFKDLFRDYDTYLGKLDVLTSDKIHWTKTEGNPRDWYDTKGEMAIRAYAEQVLPHLKTVHGIQLFTMIKDDQGNMIRGFIDKIVTWELDPEANKYKDQKGREKLYHDPELAKWNGKVILFDDKFSTMKYTIPDSEQLATYSEAPNIMKVDACGYIVVPKRFRTRDEPLVNVKITIDKVLPETIQSVFEGYAETLHGIKMGEFPCDIEKCRNNRFGCPYLKYCESNGQNLEGLVYTDGKSGKTKKSNNSKVGETNRETGKTTRESGKDKPRTKKS